MVLHYLASPIDYNRILSLLEISEYGGIFSRLNKLEAVGVSVRIGNGSLETIEQHLEVGLPTLVPVETRWLEYWNVDTYHVVVVVGIENEVVYVNDPYFETSPISVPFNEFIPAWVEQRNLYALISLESFEEPLQN